MCPHSPSPLALCDRLALAEEYKPAAHHGVEPGAHAAHGWPGPGFDILYRHVDPAAQACYVCLGQPGAHDCCSSSLHWEHPVCQVWVGETLEAEGKTLPLLAGEVTEVRSEVL